MKIFTPIVEHLKLQIRLNLKTRNVEIKVCMCLMFRVHPGTLYMPLGHLDTYPSCKRDFVWPLWPSLDVHSLVPKNLYGCRATITITFCPNSPKLLWEWQDFVHVHIIYMSIIHIDTWARVLLAYVCNKLSWYCFCTCGPHIVRMTYSLDDSPSLSSLPFCFCQWFQPPYALGSP